MGVCSARSRRASAFTTLGYWRSPRVRSLGLANESLFSDGCCCAPFVIPAWEGSRSPGGAGEGPPDPFRVNLVQRLGSRVRGRDCSILDAGSEATGGQKLLSRAEFPDDSI